MAKWLIDEVMAKWLWQSGGSKMIDWLSCVKIIDGGKITGGGEIIDGVVVKC